MINENDSPQNSLENQGKTVLSDDKNLMNITQYLNIDSKNLIDFCFVV